MIPTLEQAKKKDKIIEYFVEHGNNFFGADDIVNAKVTEAGLSEINQYILDIEFRGYVTVSPNLQGKIYRASPTAEHFLNQGGFTAEFTEVLEQEALLNKESTKDKRRERQEDFIRFGKVIKTGVWLVVLLISIVANIFFLLKYVFRWL